MIALLALQAHATGLRVVRAGETLTTISSGDAQMVEALRALNDLQGDQQPLVGTLLRMPEQDGVHAQDGTLLSLWGRGELIPPGGVAAPLVEGMTLPVGSVICTDSDSYATVRMASVNGQHDDVTMLSSTCITLEAVTQGHDERSSVLSLDRGGLSIRAAETPGEVTVVTQSGLTTGGGGGFRVSLETGAVRTEALLAAVSVFGAGEEVAVDAGYGSRTFSEQPPSPPSRLLAPEALLLPEDGAELRRPDFSWVAVDRALAYRVEVSVTEDFSTLVRAAEVPRTDWNPEVLFTPYRVEGLWWRVSPIDRAGFVGLPSDASTLHFPVGTGL